MMEKTSELLQKRKAKFNTLKESDLQLFPNDFGVSHTINDIKMFVEKTPETRQADSPIFAVAGRMVAINRFGKSTFIRFRDRSGRPIFARIKSAMRPISCSSNWMSGILWALRARCFKPKPENGPCWPINYDCFARPSGHYRKNFTALKIPKNDIGSDTWT